MGSRAFRTFELRCPMHETLSGFHSHFEAGLPLSVCQRASPPNPPATMTLGEAEVVSHSGSGRYRSVTSVSHAGS